MVDAEPAVTGCTVAAMVPDTGGRTDRTAGEPGLRGRWTRLFTCVFGPLLVVAAACSSGVTVSDDEAQADTPAENTADLGPTASPEADEVAEATPTAPPAPTAAPEPTATPEPTAVPTPAVEVGLVEDVLLQSSAVASDVEACLVAAALADEDLLEELRGLGNTAGIGDLSPEGADLVVDAAAGCMDGDDFAAVITDGFLRGVNSDLTNDPATGQCLAAAFGRPDQQRQFVEVSLLAAEAPDEATDAVIAAMVECVPAQLWADAFSGVVVEQAALQDLPSGALLLDDPCVAELFGDEEFAQVFLSDVIRRSGADTGPAVAPAAAAPLFGCINFGLLFAEVFAAQGVELSDETIGCLDTEARDAGLLERLAQGQAVDDVEVGVILLPCLTALELSQIGSG